jgi:hypothetical protein
MVILLVLTISANGELELPELEDDEELEPPRLPAVAPLWPPVDEVDEDPVVEDAEALEVDPAETGSPAERLARDTIVPLIGA